MQLRSGGSAQTSVYLLFADDTVFLALANRDLLCALEQFVGWM